VNRECCDVSYFFNPFLLNAIPSMFLGLFLYLYKTLSLTDYQHVSCGCYYFWFLACLLKICRIIMLSLFWSSYRLLHLVFLNNPQENMRSDSSIRNASPLERILALVISHVGQKPCICPTIDLQWSFSSQMLTIPLLWRLFPNLKEVLCLNVSCGGINCF
jgi:hypothetical protein